MARVGLLRKSKIKGGSIKETNDEKLEKQFNEVMKLVNSNELEAKGLTPNKVKQLEESEKIRKKFHI